MNFAITLISLTVIIVLDIGIQNVNGIKCHRCIYTDPHDDSVQEVLNQMQSLADPTGYKMPDWRKMCLGSPSEDLGVFSRAELSPTSDQLFELYFFVLSLLLNPSNETWNGEAKSDLKSNMIDGNQSVGQDRTIVPVCFAMNVIVKSEDSDAVAEFVFRDGALANLKNGVNVINKCYQGVEAVADIVGQQYVQPFKKYVKDVEACVCDDVDGCNHKSFGAGYKSQTYFLLIIFSTIFTNFTN